MQKKVQEIFFDSEILMMMVGLYMNILVLTYTMIMLYT